jgi:hypothetical protein
LQRIDFTSAPPLPLRHLYVIVLGSNRSAGDASVDAAMDVAA